MKIIFPALIILILASPLSAEKQAEVMLRYGKQENSIRIVLEAGEDLIRNANTITSLLAVKIEFPSAFELKKQTDFIFETSQKDRFLTISLNDVLDVKTYKLASPPRIVIDLKTPPRPQKELPKTEVKPQTEGVQPSAKPARDAAPQDAQKPATVQTPPKTPLPGAQPPEKVLKLKICVIDPGHGGHDPGIVTPDMKEKDINLGIARDLAAALAKKGITTHLTRRVDQAVSLSERINFTSLKKPDLFLAVHATAAEGWAIYTAVPEDVTAEAAIKLYAASSRQARHIERSRALARALETAVKTEFKAGVRTRELPLPVLSSSDAPSVLVEYPISSSPIDQKMRDRIVRALLSGMAGYEQ
ncbi:MAG: N-acetylmuramoyl-L-alanine amidase family protein [Thermodesulfovibrionales bacterium]